MFRTGLAVATLVFAAGAAIAAPQSYAIDTAHSQVVFSFDHHGFAPVTGLLTGVGGAITFDPEAPEASTVTATIPLASLTTGHAPQDSDILSPDFLGAEAGPEVSFTSTSITVTGLNTALIAGDLTLNGITRAVVLDTTLNRQAASNSGTPTLGLVATTKLLRSDFDAGRSAPANSDAVTVRLSIEATRTPE